MSQQTIELQQIFDAPVDQVFPTLCDHERFGAIVGAPTERIVDSDGDNPNGVGSVRRMAPMGRSPGAFEEKVTRFEPNQLMEYTVVRGGPFKNHKGRMEFAEHEGRTHLNYTIVFEPRWPLPLLGPTLKMALGTLLGRSLKRYANSLK